MAGGAGPQMHRVRGRGSGPSQDNLSRTLCGVEHLVIVKYLSTADVRSPTAVAVMKTTFPSSVVMDTREAMSVVLLQCILFVNRKGMIFDL